MTDDVAKKDSRYQKKNALEEWLSTQPREVSVIIGARAALRALPLAVRESAAKDAGQFGALISTQFRADALARIVARYPIRAVELDSILAASKAAWSLGDAIDGSAAAAAAGNAADAAAGSNAAVAGNAAAWAAHWSAAWSTSAWADSAWAAVSEDKDFLSRRSAPMELADRPLWPEGSQPDFVDLWA
jgi:hypothetical protein